MNNPKQIFIIRLCMYSQCIQLVLGVVWGQCVSIEGHYVIAIICLTLFHIIRQCDYLEAITQEE